jgi:hypothetical protein
MADQANTIHGGSAAEAGCLSGVVVGLVDVELVDAVLAAGVEEVKIGLGRERDCFQRRESRRCYGCRRQTGIQVRVVWGNGQLDVIAR